MMQRNFILDIKILGKRKNIIFGKVDFVEIPKFQSIDIDDKKIGMMQKFYGKY